MKSYDIIVVGAGPGGYVAAIKAAKLGNSVAIIEKEYYGGVCLNVGCIPTKTLLKNAKVFSYVQNAAKYGVDIEGAEAISPNWQVMQKRKNKVVKKLTKGVEFLLKRSNVELYSGFAKHAGDHQIDVDGETLEYKKLILATGSKPRLMDLPGLKEAYDTGFVTTSTELLSVDSIPESLVIVGGGVIGMEFASLFNALGTDVTVIEYAPTILPAMDDEVKTELHKIFKKQGINIQCNAKVTHFDNQTVYYDSDGKTTALNPQKVLFSVGRTINLQGFEELSIDKRKNGSIITDSSCLTSHPDIYAIGDINGQVMLAHLASAEGIVAAESASGHAAKINYDAVPGCVYTFPEIANVGKTEQQLIAEGANYTATKFPISANGKSMAEGDSVGFIKMLADKENGLILGVHIISANATDLIAEVVTAMELKGTAEDLAKAIHPHPSVSEIIMEAAHGIAGHSIHI